MNTANLLALPPRKATRDHIFGIRLTPDEREAIFNLAHKLEYPASEMARHFVLQAVAFHTAYMAEKGRVNAAQS